VLLSFYRGTLPIFFFVSPLFFSDTIFPFLKIAIQKPSDFRLSSK